MNLSDNDTPKIVSIGLTFTQEERVALIHLLLEFIDVFAWSYQDMPGIDREIAQHTIPIIPDSKPVKYKLRRMKPDVALKIKEEVTKQLTAGFIKVANYPEWIANVV